MKKLFAIFGICALLGAPAFAQTDNNKEETQDEAAQEVPTDQEVESAVAAMKKFSEDKEKVKGYCDLVKEMEGVAEGDEKKAESVGEKFEQYIASLTEEVQQAFGIAESVEPESENANKIDAAFAEVEGKCANQ